MKVFEIQGDESVRILDGVLYGIQSDFATVSIEDGAALLRVFGPDDEESEKICIGFPWGVKSQLFKDSVWRVFLHLMAREKEFHEAGEAPSALELPTAESTTGFYLQSIELAVHEGRPIVGMIDNEGIEYGTTVYPSGVNPELVGSSVLKTVLEMLFAYNKRHGIHPHDNRHRALGAYEGSFGGGW